jgi:hypothetical protein
MATALFVEDADLHEGSEAEAMVAEALASFKPGPGGAGDVVRTFGRVVNWLSAAAGAG